MSAVAITSNTGFCNQTEVMQRASGGLPGILGSYTHCPVVDNVQFCVLFPRQSVWGNSRLIGYCLPSQCTLIDIAQHVLSDPLLNSTFNYSDLLISSPMTVKNALSQYINCGSRKDSVLTVYSQNIVSWTILGLIIVLVLLATLYDYYRRVTCRIIPFEIVRMGSDGGVVRVLQSPNQTTTTSVIRNENTQTFISSHGYQTYNNYRNDQEERQKEEQEEEEVRIREISFSPSLPTSISQPLLLTREGDSMTENNTDNNNNNNNNNNDNILHQLHVSPLETVGRESVMTKINSKSYRESLLGGRKETRVNVSTLKTTGILPDFGMDALWSNRRMQQLLVEIPDVPDFHSIINQVVLCLSLINSFRKWRYYPKSEANINLFNSWRVLAWMWIMLFSIFWYSQQIPTIENVGSRRSNFFYAFLEKEAFAGFAVSTFLVIAGFLALHRLHTSEEAFLSSPTARVQVNQRGYGKMIQNGIIWYIKYLVARFVRIVPITFGILALLPNSVPNVGSGPFWTLFINAPALHVNCVKYWWTNFLLINNILPLDWNERCFPWSYYVALEFQLSALAPLIYILGKHLHHRLFSALLLFAMITSSVLRYVELTRQGNVSFTLSSISHYSLPVGTVYQYPHLMFIPFCAGSMLYYLYKGVQRRAEMLRMFGSDILSVVHRIQDGAIVEDRASYWLLEQLRKRRMRILFLWSGLCITLTCILSAWVVHRDELSGNHSMHPAVKVYESLILFPWCIGLCLLALPLLFGYGGMFRRILIHRLWCGPSRLVLVAYLLAPLVIGFGNASSYEVMTMNFLLLMVQWFGYTVATLLVAFVFHMLIERPCLHVSSRGEY